MSTPIFRWLRRLPAPRSLRKQLLATSLLILSGLLLLIGVLQYILMRDFIYSNRAESMEAQIRSVPREMFFNFFNSYDEDTTGINDTNNEFNSNFPMEREDMNKMPSGLRTGENRRPLLLDAHTTLAMYSSDGTFRDLQQLTLSDIAAPRLTNEQYDALLIHTTDRATGNYKLIQAEDGTEHLAIFMNLYRPGNTRLLLQMSVSTGPLTDVIMQQLLIYAGLSVIALLTGLFLYLPALRKTLVPLSNMGESAEIINAGNLDIRFPVDQGQAEIDKLAHSFNGMLERLEISFHNEREAKEQMRRFAADASHELRTPLTSIHGFLEVLLRGAADNKEQLYNSLRSMHGESKRINKLVEDLLLLARMDGAPQLQMTDLILSEVIHEMKPHLLLLADQRKVTFDISYGIRGKYDPYKLKQVILNLFHNAVQHTDAAAGSIHLSLQAAGNQALLSVRDNGCGIPTEHIPHIFDRFYRSDSSRTRKYGGSGLGLSITKSIVEAHHGKISVNSTVGEGTTFTVSLPCEEGLAKEE
ncbi:sensor histidine kinase [Paenibacillus odorifer]|uniref:sensor histidine kinase n=1 Tax=Paenibacillus odorifer TaxID=189426 RepID=UPI0004F7AE1E|nr:HAMP domain-containing sensor histidine kinase [Paenibacillus odorifer]AIQ72310.1 membrane protein [Paenibacillus odorifer]